MEISLKQSALCAYNALTRRWVPISLGTLSKTPILTPPPPPQPLIRQVQEELTLASWNVDAFTSRPSTRASLILTSLLDRPKVPDIVFFQEVRRDVYDYLLRDERLSKGFFATDGEDQTAFHNVPFTTVMLLSRKRFVPGNPEMIEKQEGSIENAQILLGQPGRTKFPSKYGRDGLFIDIANAEHGAIRLVNVHLDSLSHAFNERSEQIATLTRDLRDNGYRRGLVAGDFNAISLEDHKLVDENGLKDQWIALHGEESTGHTWGVDRQELKGPRPGRLDKVTMIGLEATKMEVVPPGKIAVPRPGETDDEKPWSDHCGLICSFNI